MSVRFWLGRIRSFFNREVKTMKILDQLRRWLRTMRDPVEKARRAERNEALKMAKFLERNQETDSDESGSNPSS